MSDYLNTLFSLEGKTAVVVGGAGELCGEMAEALAKADAEVALVDLNQEKAEARIRKIQEAGGKAYAEGSNDSAGDSIVVSIKTETWFTVDYNKS